QTYREWFWDNHRIDIDRYTIGDPVPVGVCGCFPGPRDRRKTVETVWRGCLAVPITRLKPGANETGCGTGLALTAPPTSSQNNPATTALQNLYWRSRRPGLPADQAESLKDVIAKASHESSRPQEAQQKPHNGLESRNPEIH